MEAAEQVWTSRRLMDWMVSAFRERGVEQARLCSELLLCHVMKCDRLRLFMDPDRPATMLERGDLRGLAGRVLRGEPIQYVLGEWPFFGMTFITDRRALIPRPETELLVEHGLLAVREMLGIGPDRSVAGTVHGGRVLVIDVCTGSGVVGLALLKDMLRYAPSALCLATDIDEDALVVARENARVHGLGHAVEFVRTDGLTGLGDHPSVRESGGAHAIVSNPPYIPDDEWDAVPGMVKDFEPERALRGGADGFSVAGPLLREGGALLRPGGVLLIELATSRVQEGGRLAQASGHYEDVRVLKDQFDKPRAVFARRRR